MKSREIINELILGGSVSQFSCSAVSDALWPHGLQHLRPPCPSLTLKPTQTHAHWVGDVIQPSQPLLSPFPPTFNLSQHQGLFKWVCSLYQVAQVLGVSASTSVLPMDYSGLISFRMDCLDLLAVKGTLKSLFQHHSSKTSILRRSAFFVVQVSHPYMTTGKTIALTRRTFGGKVISLLFNMLSRFVIAFFLRSKSG